MPLPRRSLPLLYGLSPTLFEDGVVLHMFTLGQASILRTAVRRVGA
jgi:hypothetical protein